MPIYLRPASLKSALTTLAKAARSGKGRSPIRSRSSRVAPTFTRRVPANRLGSRAFPRDFLDITQIPELKGIEPDGRALLIGAATTWTDIAEARLPPAFDALKQAALQIGGLQIQNRGTLGGNIVNASPAADGVPPLLALDARGRDRLAARRAPRAARDLHSRQPAHRSCAR